MNLCEMSLVNPVPDQAPTSVADMEPQTRRLVSPWSSLQKVFPLIVSEFISKAEGTIQVLGPVLSQAGAFRWCYPICSKQKALLLDAARQDAI